MSLGRRRSPVTRQELYARYVKAYVPRQSRKGAWTETVAAPGFGPILDSRSVRRYHRVCARMEKRGLLIEPFESWP